MTPSGSGRRKVMALFLSGIFPGLGQLYNRQLVKAMLFLLAGIVLSWLFMRAVPTDPVVLLSSPPGSNVIVPMFALLVIWIWSVIDAMKNA